MGDVVDFDGLSGARTSEPKRPHTPVKQEKKMVSQGRQRHGDYIKKYFCCDFPLLTPQPLW